MIMESDKISALKISYDILSGSTASYEDPEEDFTVKVVKLAEPGQKALILSMIYPKIAN